MDSNRVAELWAMYLTQERIYDNLMKTQASIGERVEARYKLAQIWNDWKRAASDI